MCILRVDQWNIEYKAVISMGHFKWQQFKTTVYPFRQINGHFAKKWRKNTTTTWNYDYDDQYLIEIIKKY